jgi:hypothetical protein
MDRPVFESAFLILLNKKSDIRQRARLLAISARPSDDWQHALPIAARGKRPRKWLYACGLAAFYTNRIDTLVALR